MTKPLERAGTYMYDDGWDIDGLAVDLMILIRIAGISREAVHKKMDQLYDEVEAQIADFNTEGNA